MLRLLFVPLRIWSMLVDAVSNSICMWNFDEWQFLDIKLTTNFTLSANQMKIQIIEIFTIGNLPILLDFFFQQIWLFANRFGLFTNKSILFEFTIIFMLGMQNNQTRCVFLLANIEIILPDIFDE